MYKRILTSERVGSRSMHLLNQNQLRQQFFPNTREVRRVSAAPEYYEFLSAPNRSGEIRWFIETSCNMAYTGQFLRYRPLAAVIGCPAGYEQSSNCSPGIVMQWPEPIRLVALVAFISGRYRNAVDETKTFQPIHAEVIRRFRAE